MTGARVSRWKEARRAPASAASAGRELAGRADSVTALSDAALTARFLLLQSVSALESS